MAGASKSVGSLYIDIEARTAKLEEDMKRVRAAAGAAQADLTNIGAKYAAAMDQTGILSKIGLGKMSAGWVGLGLVIAAAGAELKSVYDNIESIPGVSPATLQSVEAFKFGLHEAKRALDQFVAPAVGYVTSGVQSMGWAFVAAAGGEEYANEQLAQFNANAEKFAHLDFDKKIAALEEKTMQLGKSKGFLVDELREEAAALRDLANGSKVDQAVVDRHPEVKELQEEVALLGISKELQQQILLIAGTKELDAAEAGLRLHKQAEASMERYTDSLHRSGIESKGVTQQLAFWNRELDSATNALRAGMQKIQDGQRGVGTEEVIDAYKHMTEAENRIEKLKAKMKEPALIMANSFRDAFSQVSGYLADFVITGKFKLTDFANSFAREVLGTFLKLALINPVLNGLFGGIGGWQHLATIGGGAGAAAGGATLSNIAFADGGRPPVGKASLIGEEGPELWVPDGPGTIIPNHAMRNFGSSGGDTYNIDARGSDSGQLARLEQMILSLNGSIRKRTIAASIDDRRRRPAGA